MPDGYKRRRRNGNGAQAKWYATYRANRFARRFMFVEFDLLDVCFKFKGEN